MRCPRSRRDRCGIYTDFAAPASAKSGQRPLPAIADLQGKARSWGLRRESLVIVYDDDRSMTAARASRVLRFAPSGNERDPACGATLRGRAVTGELRLAPGGGAIIAGERAVLPLCALPG